jgi:7-carboxy-7-deazaguanine synthase
MMLDLKLTEVFFSLQGESTLVGLPTVFIRLTGCPLRCHYCDTAYAFHGGKRWLLADILSHIKQYHTSYVTVTGGEPLAQKNCCALLTALCDANYHVSLETSGAISMADVDARVVKVMDIKTPASGEAARHLWANMDLLSPNDQVKFVICDRDDYRYAYHVIQDHALTKRCHVLLSPSHDQCDPQDLAQWILDDRLMVRFQMQMHKLIWGDVSGR